MTTGSIDIRCMYCSHRWSVRLADLGKTERVIYKGGEVRREDYRLSCPACGKWNVVTIEIEEENGDGQGTRHRDP